MNSHRALCVLLHRGGTAWIKIDTTNIPANGAAQANPEAGRAPAVRLPARGGAAPPPGEPMTDTTDRAHAGRPRRVALVMSAVPRQIEREQPAASTADMSAAALRPEAGLPTDGMRAMIVATPPAEAALPAASMGMIAARLRREEALLPAAANTARGGAAPHPAPAEAGDTPADLPARREKRRRRRGAIVSASSQGRFSSSPSHWLSSR